MCYTLAGVGWVRLRPGSDDSSKLGACLWFNQGFLVLILVLLLFQLQEPTLGLVVHHVLEMFAFACVLFSVWSGLKLNIVAGTVNPIIYLLSNYFVSNIQIKLPQANVEHLHYCSYILFHHQSWWFHYPLPTITPDPRSFMFSLTKKSCNGFIESAHGFLLNMWFITQSHAALF